MEGSFEHPPIIIVASRSGIIKAIVLSLAVAIGLAVCMLYAEGPAGEAASGFGALLFILAAAIGLKRLGSPNKLFLSPEGLTAVDPRHRSWTWNTFSRFECQDCPSAITNGMPRPIVRFVLRRDDGNQAWLEDSWEISIRRLSGLLNTALTRWGGPLPHPIPQIEPGAVSWRAALQDAGSKRSAANMLERLPLVITKSLSKRLLFAAIGIGLIVAIAVLTGGVARALLLGVCFFAAMIGGPDAFGHLFLPARLFVTRDGIVFSDRWDEFPVPWAEIGEFYVRLNIFMYPGLAGIGYRPASVYRLEQPLGMFWEVEPKELCAFLNAAKARYGDVKK